MVLSSTLDRLIEFVILNDRLVLDHYPDRDESYVMLSMLIVWIDSVAGDSWLNDSHQYYGEDDNGGGLLSKYSLQSYDDDDDDDDG